jgi:hypothetical protein
MTIRRLIGSWPDAHRTIDARTRVPPRHRAGHRSRRARRRRRRSQFIVRLAVSSNPDSGADRFQQAHRPAERAASHGGHGRRACGDGERGVGRLMQPCPHDQRGGDDAARDVSSDCPARKHGIPFRSRVTASATAWQGEASAAGRMVPASMCRPTLFVQRS